ncbi:MAG: hypothetical protein ABSA32_03070 [Candidatus Acidiferrales bacterium]|jgi:hypothetical protein
MRSAIILVTLGLAFSVAAQAKKPPQEIKIKIDSTGWDKTLLLEKMNGSGRFHGLHFDESEEAYEYRIAYGTGQDPAAVQVGQMNATSGTVTVFDAQGKELFDFVREGRFTDAGVTNAIAKEIVKRLLIIRSQTPQ